MERQEHEPSDPTIERIAEACHEANRAYCVSIGDTSQPAWSDAPEWQKESARLGVLGIARGEITRPEQSHESWSAQKIADGWVFGPTKDPVAKTHPCLVPYAELPPEQQAKDTLFYTTASSLLLSQVEDAALAAALATDATDDLPAAGALPPGSAVTGHPPDLVIEKATLYDASAPAGAAAVDGGGYEPAPEPSTIDRVKEFLQHADEDVKQAFHGEVLSVIDALGPGSSVTRDQTTTTVMAWRNGARVYGHGATAAEALAELHQHAGPA